ncbi:MAG: sigma-70 family RNA polymerase sigma factor [Candidatus Limnocylindrales bacterium]
MRTVVERARPSGTEVEEVNRAFADLYRQRYRDVYRYVLLMLHSANDAEEVTAEAFGRAYLAWRRGHGPQWQSSLPWLLQIARRIVIDQNRRTRVLAWLPLPFLAPNQEPRVEDETSRSDFWLWFDRFARQLPQRQREVLILRYQRDLDDQTIGEILGLSPSGVRSLVSRACETLRRNPEVWR